MFFRSILWGVIALSMVACSSPSFHPKSIPGETVSFPLLRAWYNGEEVFYITTDVSDREIAKLKNANYAPRLRDAVPHYPKPPHVKTALERVYDFPNGEQDRGVFASVPAPLGPESRDPHYSPLWLRYVVKWNDPSQAYELTSEEAIFVAEDQGLVTITRTDVVLNCPVIPFALDK